MPKLVSVEPTVEMVLLVRVLEELEVRRRP